MKKFIKLLACLLVVTMAFAFGACGQVAEDPAPTTPPAAEQPGETPPEEPPKLTTFLDKDAATTYAEIEEYLESYTNYTFNLVEENDITMKIEAPGYGSMEFNLGILTINAAYSYTENAYAGVEEYVATDNPESPFPLTEIIDESCVKIICTDNVCYMFSEGNEGLDIPDIKWKDNATFEELQTSTGIDLNVSDMPLYGPSADALADGYFELSDDGAILTVVISGEEAEVWRQNMFGERFDAEFEYSDITYKVYLDSEGNMEKVVYELNYTADLGGGNIGEYDVVGTITFTDIGSTVITAPADANTYTQVDFV